MYMLIKFEELVPKVFICPSSETDVAMELEFFKTNCPDPTDYYPEDWTDLSDFHSGFHFSYSYNDPFNNLCNSSSPSSTALIADKNPAYADEVNGVCTIPPDPTSTGSNGTFSPDFGDWPPKIDATDGGGTKFPANSWNHRTECQNVLFAGFNVERPSDPAVGLARDNIYSHWDTTQIAAGNDELGKMIGKWAEQDPEEMSENRHDSYVGN